MKVLVTGGTGMLGRSVVERLCRAGHGVRVLTRDPSRAPATPARVENLPGNLSEPGTLRAPLSAVEVVVHCASDPKAAAEVDVAGTANLLRVMRELGVAHLVHVSIVGVDRLPIRYYRAKQEVERMIERQPVPWTIQRATQFHPFVDAMLLRSARLPVVVCPSGLRFQPVAVQDVADRLVQHVSTGPSGRTPAVGGPEVLTLRQLADTWLRFRARRRVLLPTPFPGRLGRAFREGANLCPEEATDGVTWKQYLHAVHGVPAGR